MSFNFSDFALKLAKALEHVHGEVAQLRTGRATTQMLDGVKVEAYGTLMRLQEIGTVAAPDPTLLTITPWDKSLVGAIEKGIQIANLNLQPIVDGEMVRISVPPLTEERRKEMVKMLAQRVETGRIMLRTIRTETKKDIEKQKGQPGVSEDQITHDIDELEKHTKQALDKLDHLMAEKEKELMKV
jgi:ribosome recycling factor